MYSKHTLYIYIYIVHSTGLKSSSSWDNNINSTITYPDRSIDVLIEYYNTYNNESYNYYV